MITINYYRRRRHLAHTLNYAQLKCLWFENEFHISKRSISSDQRRLLRFRNILFCYKLKIPSYPVILHPSKFDHFPHDFQNQYNEARFPSIQNKCRKFKYFNSICCFSSRSKDIAVLYARAKPGLPLVWIYICVAHIPIKPVPCALSEKLPYKYAFQFNITKLIEVHRTLRIKAKKKRKVLLCEEKKKKKVKNVDHSIAVPRIASKK